MPTNLDPAQLSLVSLKKAAAPVLAALNAIDQFPKEQRILGAAMLFTLMARKYNVHPGTVLGVANNMIDRTQELGEPEYWAIRDYLNHRMEER